jgi:hypothetical protein
MEETAKDAPYLPLHSMRLEMPSGRGAIGISNVWVPDDTALVERFAKRVEILISKFNARNE